MRKILGLYVHPTSLRDVKIILQVKWSLSSLNCQDNFLVVMLKNKIMIDRISKVDNIESDY